MRYIKSFQLFESFYDNENDIQDLIDDLEDRLDIQLLKKEYSTHWPHAYAFSDLEFIFKSNKSHEEILDSFNWFIDSILRLDKIRIKMDEMDENGRIFVPNEGKTENLGDNKYKVVIKGHGYELIEHLIVDFKSDPDAVKQELKSLDVNQFIHDLFKFGLKFYYNRIDFEMLEAFRTDKDVLLEPIHFDSVRLPYNLHEQFKIDITPIFLEKVYKNSGFIFRLGLSSSYQFNMVTKGDRLTKESISKETDNKLKELGLNLTWKDVFVKQNNRNYF